MRINTYKPEWFLTPPSDDMPIRLFCFPYSGCGASMYRFWPSRIGEVEVIPLQLPGRENRMREPHYGSYEELADALVPGIANYLDRPYALFGHCGGVLPGFETLLRIEKGGLPPPERFFVSSQVAPQDGPYGRFLGLTRDGLEQELFGLLRALGTSEPPAEIIELYLEVLVADVEANKAYHKHGPVSLPCATTAIGWTRDAEVPHELMRGWDACAPTEHILLEGTHHTFLEAPLSLMDRIAVDLLQK